MYVDDVDGDGDQDVVSASTLTAGDRPGMSKQRPTSELASAERLIMGDR